MWNDRFDALDRWTFALTDRLLTSMVLKGLNSLEQLLVLVGETPPRLLLRHCGFHFLLHL